MSANTPLALSCQGVAKILHITDTHLFADNKDELLGVNSNTSFLAVIDEIEAKKTHFDLIVATGDFVQDGSKEAYQRFAQRIKTLAAPCVWLAGNHDVYAHMQEVFAINQLADNKVILLGEKWIVILLNSQVVGQAYGFLPPEQLDFLQQSIKDYPNRLALVFLHHHPVLSRCNWLDEHALKNREELGLIVKNTPQIKGVGWGHVHQRQEQIWHQRFSFATPSTCVQFKSKCNEFKLSNDESPGWRELELCDHGEIKTEVYRIDGSKFLADLSQLGY